MNEKKIQILNSRILGTIFFIGTTIVSISLLYNTKLKLSNNSPFFDQKEAHIINVSNSTIILIIALYFQYLNYQNKKEDISSSNLPIITSYFLIIAALLSLYNSFLDSNMVIEIENPSV
ncbi:MAG: hypothetical protein PHD10_01155 [Bacilli bacterium]|nr:hypothetical protein [Bacilli bacterium]MDD4607729.1 hypothetical protein [Bacilli bacterium]